MDYRAFVDTVYEHLRAGDGAAAASLLPPGIVLAVPGRTRISGDHRGAPIRDVLTELATSAAAGTHRMEPVCVYGGGDGLVAIFDNIVEVDGETQKYHSAHEWIFRDGTVHAWLIYVHEFDVFEAAWGSPSG